MSCRKGVGSLALTRRSRRERGRLKATMGGSLKVDLSSVEFCKCLEHLCNFLGRFAKIGEYVTTRGILLFFFRGLYVSNSFRGICLARLICWLTVDGWYHLYC